MAILDIKDNKSLINAAQVLKNGGILVFPTDTVYGIGCLLNEKAIKKLYKIKNRPLSQPTAVLLTKKLYHSIRSSGKSGIDIPDKIKKKFLNGEITLVSQSANLDINFPKIIVKDSKIGIRLPNYPWLEKLIDKVGPIVTSSANKKGKPAPKNFKELDPEIIKKSDLVIESHKKLKGKPSMVLDIEENKIIRF